MTDKTTFIEGGYLLFYPVFIMLAPLCINHT